jgi:hypothetical protein
MKTALRLSILLNCGLIVLLVLWALHGRAPASRFLPAAASGACQGPTGEPEQQAATTAGTGPMPSRWSQLESSDYRTYVANLRSIGCPEQTLRDIITADVGSLFALKRAPLEAELATLSGGSPGAHSGSRPTVAAEVLRLRREEAALIASLLGPAPGVSMPLVFQDVDLAALRLDPGQRQAIEDLRQRFVEDIGGPNQDATDPAYRERWQQSQPENDGLLRGLIGVRAWQDYQLAARTHE